METTLGNVQIESSFWFGGVQFIKDWHKKDDEFIGCHIFGTTCRVYITECAWVRTTP